MDPISWAVIIAASTTAGTYLVANGTVLSSGASVLSLLSSTFSDKTENKEAILKLYKSTEAIINILQKIDERQQFQSRYNVLKKQLHDFFRWVNKYSKKWWITKFVFSGTYRREIQKFDDDIHQGYQFILLELFYSLLLRIQNSEQEDCGALPQNSRILREVEQYYNFSYTGRNHNSMPSLPLSTYLPQRMDPISRQTHRKNTSISDIVPID